MPNVLPCLIPSVEPRQEPFGDPLLDVLSPRNALARRPFPTRC